MYIDTFIIIIFFSALLNLYYYLILYLPYLFYLNLLYRKFYFIEVVDLIYSLYSGYLY